MCARAQSRVRSSAGGRSIMHSIIFISRSNIEDRAYALDHGFDWRIGCSNRESSKFYLIYIILPMLERIHPQIRPVLSAVFRMPNQLIPLAVPQDQDKVIPQNKCNASHHQHTLMFVMKAPYTTWQYSKFAILLSFLLSSTYHENSQEWVSH